MKLAILSFVSVSWLAVVFGHGRMYDPISRNAAWRLNLGTPVDYEDDMKNCGGFGTQWDQYNQGRCGVCGDPWNTTNPQNVYPGKYATGKVTKHYRRGQAFNLDIQITANHGGWSEFRVGKIGTLPITSEKLTHLLELEDGSGTRWPMPEGLGFFHVRLRLPNDLMCDHCVLQWWWRAGNNWGCDSQGNCGNGKAKEQETFVNCADIRILEEDGSPPPTDTPTLPPVTASPTPSAGECKATGPYEGNKDMDEWCKNTCKTGYCPVSYCVNCL